MNKFYLNLKGSDFFMLKREAGVHGVLLVHVPPILMEVVFKQEQGNVR